MAATEQRWSPDMLRDLRDLYVPLRRYAAVVGRWDVEPDDLVQEAYTRVLLTPPEQIRDLGAYMRRTIVNLAINTRRRARRAVAAVHLAGDERVDVDAYPSELADLLRLDPQVRGLLYLVEVEGEPIGTAAEAVGMSPAAARMALTRARRRLRAELREEFDGE